MALNKILLALPELKEGGVERHVFDLSTALAARGFNVAIMANSGSQIDKFKSSGAQILDLPIHSKHPVEFIKTQHRVRLAVKSFNPDIIHVHSRIPAWQLWFAKANIPFVTTCHGKYSQNLLSQIMYKGQPTIGASSYCLQDFPKQLKTNNNPQVVFNGIALHNEQMISKTNARKHLKTIFDFSDEFIIGTVARFTKLKRLDLLIEAVAKIHDIPLKLVLIGSGSEEANLKHLVIQHKIQDRTEFIGRKMDLLDILPGFDLFINPCPVEGGTSYSVLEAMDLFVPCIGANTGGVSELIEHKSNGLLFEANDSNDLANQIRYSFENQSLSVELAKSARTDLQNKYSIDHMVDKIISVYKQAIIWR